MDLAASNKGRQTMKVRYLDIVTAIFFILVALGGYVRTYYFAEFDISFAFGNSPFIKPTFYPRFLLVVLAGLSLILLGKSLVSYSAKVLTIKPTDLFRMVWYFAACIAYTLVAYSFDYFNLPQGTVWCTSTFLFLIATGYGLGYRKIPTLMAASAGLVALLFVVFAKLFLVMLI